MLPKAVERIDNVESVRMKPIHRVTGVEHPRPMKTCKSTSSRSSGGQKRASGPRYDCCGTVSHIISYHIVMLPVLRMIGDCARFQGLDVHVEKFAVSGPCRRAVANRAQTRFPSHTAVICHSLPSLPIQNYHSIPDDVMLGTLHVSHVPGPESGSIST